MKNKGKILLMDAEISWVDEEGRITSCKDKEDYRSTKTIRGLEAAGYEVQVLRAESREDPSLDGVVAIVGHTSDMFDAYDTHPLKERIWQDKLLVPVIGYTGATAFSLKKDEKEIWRNTITTGGFSFPLHLATVCQNYRGRERQPAELAKIVTDSITSGSNLENGQLYDFYNLSDLGEMKRETYLKIR